MITNSYSKAVICIQYSAQFKYGCKVQGLNGKVLVIEIEEEGRSQHMALLDRLID